MTIIPSARLVCPVQVEHLLLGEHEPAFVDFVARDRHGLAMFRVGNPAVVQIVPDGAAAPYPCAAH